MKLNELKKKYNVKTHYSAKEMHLSICKKGFTKSFESCTEEEIVKEYSERCSRNTPVTQLEFIVDVPAKKKERKDCKKIGKYKADVSSLAFNPPQSLRMQLLENCRDFNLDYGVILNKIFADVKWDTWNNREWLTKLSEEGK